MTPWTVTDERLTQRLRSEMAKHISDTGVILFAEAYEPDKGGGWIVVFDTEYAALKVYYKYRYNKSIKLGEAATGWWYVSTQVKS